MIKGSVWASSAMDGDSTEASEDTARHSTVELSFPQAGLYNRINIPRPVMHLDMNCSSPLISEESALDCDPSVCHGNPIRQALFEGPSMQAVSSGGQPSESNAAYFHWPAPPGQAGNAEDRFKFFKGLQKAQMGIEEILRQQATTLLDLMMIRAYNSSLLKRFSLATAIGFRTRKGVLTNIPAIIVFVARKVHKEWLDEVQILPSRIPGPGGIWCDVDVVEFSYFTSPRITPKEPVYTELADRLQGNDPTIGTGSQVASQETFGTLGAIVQSRTGACQVGFLTNRHVAVNLDYPNQKMFHPLPPNLGPGVYLGAVERATSFITDYVWYNLYASANPETFVRADGAFIPFADTFDMKHVVTTVKGLGDMGEAMKIDLQKPIGAVVGREVVKVGRSSGLTKGRIMAYALEYNDEKGICFFTDFLIVGKESQTFDLEGDSGSLILMTDEGEKPCPVGIIWGGTANRGRLKLQIGREPENWTSGVDLGHLLELLQLDLITSNERLREAVQKQRQSMYGWSGCYSPPMVRNGENMNMRRSLPFNDSESDLTAVEPMPVFPRPKLELIDFGLASPQGR